LAKRKGLGFVEILERDIVFQNLLRANLTVAGIASSIPLTMPPSKA